MITYNPKTWVIHILSIHKSDTIRILWKELLSIAVLTTILTYIEITYLENAAWMKDLMAVYSLIGFVLSLLLVFRTNTGYDRWWEGRNKWGELVNNTRNLSLKIVASNIPMEDKRYLIRMIANYPSALKEHLREGVDLNLLDLEKDELEKMKGVEHVPNHIAKLLYLRLRELKERKAISEMDMLFFDTNLKAFTDITGACERIKNTPIPYSYSLFLKKFIFIYVTTLPLAFISSFGYWSILLTVFVFYVLVSMEVLAEEIEDPFGRDDNDLSTDELADKIKKGITELLN